MVTPEQAFDFLGIAEPTSTQEALVDSLVELVTAEIEAYCDRLLDKWVDVVAKNRKEAEKFINELVKPKKKIKSYRKKNGKQRS